MRVVSSHWKSTVDFVAFTVAVILSFWLRFDFRIGEVIRAYPQSVLWGTCIDAAVGTIFLLYYKPYRSIWRYTGFKEVWEIARLVFWQKVLFTLAVVSLVPTVFPRSIFIISPLVSLSIMIVPRFLVRFYAEGHLRYLRKGGKRVVIIGAGDAGAQICREMAAHPELGYQLVGFVDDDRRKYQAFLHGYRVLGRIGELPVLVEKHRAETLIVAIPSAGRSLIKQVYELTAGLSVETLIMPGIYEMIGKKVSFSTLRPFEIEDLLLREPVFMDGGKISQAFRGKRVLVTGACGSIGGEIARQLILTGCQLILLDHNETGIFDLAHELGGESTVFPLITDVRFAGRLRNIMAEYRPDYIFHAAAYKHVPLMEENPAEAFLTNVSGTLNLLEACRKTTGKVVFISTDKAVHPENVMGMTKRLGEILVQSFADGSTQPECCVVRFGNVLGSRGNVLEVWKAQLERGEALTITDPEMKRYFMTTQEAVTLVIEASLMATSRSILVLKMGEMVPITELARVFCEIQGFQLGRDVELRVTGRRAGEKIVERLWEERETVEDTNHPRIWSVAPPAEEPIDWDHLAGAIRRIERSILDGETIDVREALEKLVGKAIQDSTIQG